MMATLAFNKSSGEEHLICKGVPFLEFYNVIFDG